MALVAARAEKCPRGGCARKRRCLGRLATNFHAPIGDCPAMSAAEWQAVSLGVRRNLLRLKPGLEARRARERSEAGLDRISWADRVRQYNSPEAVAARAEAARRAAVRPPGTYLDMIWYEPGGDGLLTPRDPVAAGRWLVEEMAAAGVFAPAWGGCGSVLVRRWGRLRRREVGQWGSRK